MRSKCTICGQSQNRIIHQKFSIWESESAENFREALLFLQNKVYIRTCDLQDASKVFGAELYYNRTCLPSYINKYYQAKTKKEASDIIKSQKKYFNFVY